METSFEMQEAAVRSLAERHGDTITEVLSDFAKSGGSTRGRPGYARLLEAVDHGEAGTIYSYSLSRLSRSLLDFSDLLERCRAHKVRVRLVQEGDIDYSSATGRAFANMAATFAQMERELGAERNSSSMAARIARGDYVGQAPFGTRVARGQLLKREGEDPGAVIAAFREAGSFAGAAILLNARGVPSRHSKDGQPRWGHGTVADILRRVAPADLGVPLVAPRARAKAVQDATLAGLLLCHCGATLTPRKERGASAVRGYYCSRSSRTPDHGRMYVAEAALLPWVRDEVARLRIPGDTLEIRAKASERQAELQARRRRIVSAFLDGVIDRADRDDQLHKVDDALTRETAAVTSIDIPSEVDWTKPPAALNAFLRALWSHIELTPDMQPIAASWRRPEWQAPMA